MKRKAVLFDFNRTLYDPESGGLYPDVSELLNEIRSDRRLFLYSKEEGGRSGLLESLGIAAYFEQAYFVAVKTPESVRSILETNGLSPDEILIVGDLITSELAAGREAGLETIWLRQGRYADVESDFEPDHVVRSIADLRTLLRELP